MEKSRVSMSLHTPSLKFTAGNKTKLLPSLFHVFTRSHITLAGAFWNDHVAACSTARGGGTEKNDSCGYVTAPCPSKVTQHSSPADWLKF